MHRDGSALLIVIMMLGVLALVSFTVLRNTTFLMDGVLEGEQYAKQYHATQAAMRYGIGLGLTYFDTFKQYNKEFPVELGAWPFTYSPYTGKLIFTPDEQNITIQAFLKKGKKVVCAITCQVVSQENNFVIRNWKIK